MEDGGVVVNVNGNSEGGIRKAEKTLSVSAVKKLVDHRGAEDAEGFSDLVLSDGGKAEV